MEQPVYLERMLAEKRQAIVQQTDIAPINCSYLVDILRTPRPDISKISYIFPIKYIEDAVRFFPSDEGLELVGRVPDEKSRMFYSFYKYRKSEKWDVAVTTRAGTSGPATVYHAKGNLFDVDGNGLKIIAPHDLVFNLASNDMDISRVDFKLKNLSSYIMSAHYTCRTDEREDLDKLFRNLNRKKTK